MPMWTVHVKLYMGHAYIEVLFKLYLSEFWHLYDYLLWLILSLMAFLIYLCILLLNNYFTLSSSSV